MGVKIFFLTFGLLFPAPLLATGGNLPGQALSLWWGLPFVGMLLSLAFIPLLAAHIWENHYGKIALLWSFMTIFALVNFFGIDLASKEVAQTFFHHYLPFIIIISALYTISRGIMGFNGIIWGENEPQSYPQVFGEINGKIRGSNQAQLIVF